jgi:hypothetical protein
VQLGRAAGWDAGDLAAVDERDPGDAGSIDGDRVRAGPGFTDCGSGEHQTS